MKIVRWGSQVHLRQTYGSSEVSGIVSSAALTTCSTTRDVGRASTGVFWIVDPNNHNRLAPVGAVGEVLVEGPVLGREYIDEPDKTASTFIEAPAWRASLGLSAGQQRLYKTGDLARYKDDGSIELIGRKDNQVKLRGQRIEVEEIEHQARLAEADVAEIAVELIQPKDGEDGMLACFIVVEDSASNEDELSGKRTRLDTRTQRTIGKIQDRLERFLPQYMVPAVFIPILTLPVTWSKKIDRKRLREVGSTFSGRELAELQATTQGLKRQPSTENEKALQQLWAGVLAIDADSIGLDDSFFRLGGDSIAAMKLVGEARRAGIHLTVADLFRNPKLDQLTAAAIASAHASPASIPQVEHAGPVAQSFAQGRLWFSEELHPGLTWYLMPLAVRIRGPLDLVALHSALLAVERRHETLRTTFATVDGASVQVVQPFQAKDLNIIDIVPGDEQGLTEAVHQDHSTPFDLRTEPGWRVTVYRMSNDDHVLSTVMHHIISDGWSVDVLMRELAAFYSASMRGQNPLSQVQPLSVQYRDFSAWQREQAQADEHQKQLSYWVEQLQSSRPAELLCDKPRPAALSGEADVQSIEIAGPLYAKLQSFCQLHGVTQFVVLLAAFRATHFRLTGQEDATIGTPNANRDRWEVKDMVGFFVNMQCLRIKIGDESFEELVQQVHEVAVASHANADVPFENIVSKLKNDRDLSRHPLVQLVFAVHAQRDLGQLKLEGVETENLGDTVTSRFDLEFHFSQQADGLRGSVMFSTDLYAPETIDNMLSVFRRVLETCLEQPQAAVASMPLLRDADYAKLDAMGLVRVEKTAYPRDSSVVDLFREQAAACPSRVAVKDSVAEMTYAQLDAASDVLARWLARRSLAPETLVGVFASRSCEAIVAFLGILKANLAYLPFDVKTPATRMEDILSSRPGHRLILVGAGAQLPSTKLSNIEFVSITEALDEQSAEEPGLQMPTTPHGPSATSLAYVMFTSGSTGQPKGVMVEHRGIVRLVRDNNLVQHLPSSPVMAHMANLAFDASTWEIYGTLLCGGTLVCIDAAMVLDAEAVLQTFRKHCIRTAYMAPSLFRSYILQAPALFTGLDMLCVGGEAVHLADLRAAEQYLTGKFVNGYGPTENTTFSTTFLVSKNEQYTNGVPIGRALSNSGAYVMDSGLRLVPLGVVGELVVTGDGLARGYTDPARNVDRFVSVEIGGKTVRAYRTGDYVRHRPTDGQLEFFGRMDGQVKIRGNRVELGEIEHTLRSDKVVREAVAVLQQHDGSEARLAGFVTVHEDAETADEHVDDSNESQHVDVWEEKFDADIYSPIDSVQAENIGRDFVGWTSMYDGSDIDTAEMNEWLDDTIATMLNGQRPGNVLEIGSGTGMILFNLGDGLQSYVGLDPSRKAVQFIAETAKSIPGLASKIRMYKATAADVGRLEQPVAASLVVVNSVVQYFPSLDYLFKMVQQLVELEGTRTLFFGDVRSCALHREFLATRAVHMAGDKATKADIRRMVADMERVERELLVDPAFFTALPSRLPGLVEHVEILPKKMKATNELSCYRYAAVVHVRPRDGQTQELAIRDVAHDRWIDFAERRLDRQSLLQQLKSLSSAPAVAVSNIPYSKTIVSRCLVHSLDGTEAETPDSPDWLASVHQRAQDCPSLSATELVELAQEVDCRVEISWSRQHSQQGGLDAIFHRYQPLTGERVMFRFPTDHAERPLHSLSSRPLRQQFLQKTQQRLLEMLEAQLPTYMVPQTLAILDAMPVNQNGKVDRKALEQQIDTQKGQSGLKRQPETETQRTMQQLWAGVLAIDADSIGLDDSFFRLGGDSIAAMKLVGEARRAGIHLTVADLFRNPKLIDLVRLESFSIQIVDEDIPAFSLLGHDAPVTRICAEVAASCSVNPSLLEDIYPCSPLQEGMLALTSKRSGDYVMHAVLELRDDIDEVAFQAAWEYVVQSTAILRTRIVPHNKFGLLQAVVTEDIGWAKSENLEEYLQNDKSIHMALGDPLTRYALVKESPGGKFWMVWTIHHSLYDGWSLRQIIHAVTKAYTGGVIEKQIGFHAFIKYLGQQDQDSTATYWRTTLANCQATLFPPLPPTIQQPLANATIIYQCPPLPKAASDTTKSILIRAAWAILASRYTNSDDVVFGVTVTGRNAPVTNIETMAGPTIATVPLRVRVRGDQTVSDFLKFLQQQATDMITYEQTGLQHIAKMGPSARHACGFQTLLLVQPAEYTFGNDKVIGEWLRHSQFQGFSTYVLMLQFTLAAEGVQIMANFDARVMEQWVLKKMLGQFSFILQQLAEPNPERELANIDTITTEDRRELWAWNKNVPRTIDRCIHDLFAEQVLAQPNAPAICAWDGEMSYSVLDGLSTKLAGYLVKIGVKPGDVVPLCFEKSMWTVVAMLAVLKAGGAFAPLDPDHPVSRHKEILRQTGARMVVVSAQHSARWASSSCHVVTLSEASIGQLTVEDDLPGFSATPGNAAYVLFTSGSTGIPKGVVLEHRAVSTSCLGHGRAFGITDQSRVLQFTSYTFDFCMAEIITTLLYGGCICVPSDRDRHSDLAKAINTMGANWALLTPSVAQLLNPSDVPTLKILVIGGEQVTSKDWNRWPTSVQLINGYGPTECCIVCTGYTTTQAFKTGTIGTAIASVSWVVDPEDYHKLAPLGSVGELLVEGPILARGYLNDAEKTAAAFIEDPAWLVDGCQGYAGRRGRLYKTGDLVRYDDEGNLVCLGRKDSQVKLRGQRIELGEVEHALRSDKSVRQAVAVLQKHASNEVRLAGFVTVHEDAETADGHVDNSKESQIVDIWEERFDADVYSPIDSVQAENIGRDFVGWTSMYDGSDIDKAEMNEWLDDTIATMLNGQRPGNVLEIGSGTGMILFNLGDGLQSYVGLDPSRKAVQFIAETAKSIPGLASKIRMYKATAADVGRLEQPVAASLVVVNSVVQYFPSLDYLFKMVQQLVELEGTRTLFFGDVRSCALHREFLATLAVHMAGDKATKADIRRMVADMERVERELLVDPAFFTALPSRLPGLVEHVEILPKKMKATNELSCYRYAAVVHVRPRDGQTQELAIRDVAHDRWIDFAERRLDRQSLLQQLKSLSSAPAVAVSNIPYSKTIVSRCLVHSLDGTEAETPDSPDWLASVHQRAQDCPSLSATELVELAQEVDCRVEISWSRQHSQQGGLDAIFHRYQPLTGERVMFRFPTDHAERPLHSLSSRPLRQQFLQKTQQRLLEMLEAQLPTYMVPQTLAILDAMPVNQNGKVDRKALEQQIDTQKGQSGLKRQPETETQRTMQQLWAGVLAIDADSIGLDDSFFRLGGDSIAAMKLVGEARRAGIHLTVADLFRNPKLDQLTAAAIASAHASPASIPQVEHAGPVAQSFAQGRLWFSEELHPGLTWYLMPLAVRIRGPLDLVALHSALLAVERRHETLRTTFATVDGASVQVVQPFQAKDLNIIDIVPGDEQGLTEAVHQDHSTPFDLRTEPGWRVTVYRMSNDDHVLSTVMHHIISDGWSVDVLMRELAAFYSASMRGQNPLSQVQPLSVQYRDFSAWQREQAQADEHQKQLSYWVEQLQSSRPAELLCDKPRPAALSGEADVQSIEIAGPLYAKLQSFCQLHGVTQFVVLLAAFRATHFRLTGQEDATIGTPNANRDRWEVKDMVGFFVNMQCLRIKIGDESFEELVQQVHEVAVASHANADVPFENIVSKLKNDRDLSRHPLVQLVFAVHAQRDLGQLKLEGVETENLGDTVTSRFDLEFHFSQQADGLRGSVMFSTDLYAPETIDNMLSVFRRVLETCLEQPQAAVASMPLLRDADYAKLDAMGLVRVEKTAYPRDSSVVDLFREQAAACPSRVAVKDSVAEMTYAQLDAASDVLARWLARRSLAPETLVGVFASRSCEAIVAFLGILKANLAYLPFDVKTPATRMEDILSSRPGHRIILVGAGAQLPSTKLSNIEFVSITEALDEQSAEEPGLQMPTTLHGPCAASLAYVIFTSGSTGQPKGVMVEHRGIVRLVRDNNLVQHLPSSPVMAHMANLAFDATTLEIYACLLHGGTLVCVDSATVLEVEAVLRIFREHHISTAFMAPSLFRTYALQSPGIFAALDMLYVGGEAVYPHDLVAASECLGGRLVNAYGPTENTVASTSFLVSKEEAYANGVPIGRALSNSGAYVMDSGLRLVPLGVVGELVVTGDGLARGYTDPARNVDRFVSVEIGGKTVRAYRTGDYVRHRPTDGQLEFFGRMDGQVKIRGNRVELGEIEHTLRSDKVVREAVAVLQQHDGSEARLAGFVTVHEDAETADEHVDDSNESQHVDVWEEKFDADIYSPIDSVQAENIGRDFVGWTSMYDGSDIDTAEMNEWLDDTIATMLNGQRPGNVLEIGSGTGMILFNLGDGLQSYVGLDPSRKAVQFIAETAKSIPGLASKIRMYKATAADVGRLEQPVAASLVVVNSVVQYFPSLDYLFKMVQQLVELEGTRTLFFGDVRSCALHREFLATRAVHMAGDKATKADIRRMVADMERVERELLVDPAFFTALPSRLPGLVEHVEILPKKMKATNELSCYRYAAVVHVRPRDGQTQELAIRDVAHDRWIDFAERRLDRQSLLQQLKSLSSAPAVAVSNIPYSKTIVSRCLVHSLDGTEAETPDSPDWLASVHQRAQDCPSLSATELVELAQEVDCRVEISWSRQHSQQGGLDAIFHRYQPLTGERVMFRFPTDHAERPLHSLSSRPLRQQFLQKTQQRLLEMLEAQLPTYMVPQTLAILDAMPVNQNGKVDRKALEQQIDTQKGQSGLKRQPETETQRTMQQLWAGVLAIDADSIGLDDSFFRLGGDSIAAMKLVGEARRAGIHLTVADLFRNPKLECLSRIGRKLLHRIVELVLPFSILPPAIKEDILSNQKSLGKINDLASIVDILPVTHCQKFFLSRGQHDPRIAFNYFYVEMGPQLDLYLLRNSCRKVLDHLSILRSRFVPLNDQWFQIILHDLDLPFSVHDVNESLDEASHAICMQDIERTDPLEVPTSFKVVRYKSTHNRLIIRLSHAQYDGVSFPIILRTLISIYQQEPLHPVAEFSTFLAHARKIQTLSGRYWRELLQGSRPIRVTEKLRLQVQEDISPRLVSVEKYMDAPRLPEGITMASLISSAWALVLAHITGEQDIVFGHLVAGRNSDIPEVAEIVGPCLNVIPVRTLVYPIKTSKDLIQSVQDQHVSLGESDSMGWDEIVKDCTDWPAGTMYDSLVQHQNIIARPEISFAGVTAKLNWFQNPFGEAPFLFLFSEPEDSQLKIMISGNTHFLTVERASLLVDMLAQTAQALSYSPQASLASHRLSLPGCAFNDG
ncbi:hypothetical protein CFE70_010556 [Pyrenophora teres f. teres 0-1]